MRQLLRIRPIRVLTGIVLVGALAACAGTPEDGRDREPALVVKSRDNPTGPGKGPHLISANLGASYWPALADVDPGSAGFDPDEFDAFDKWGVALNVGYEGRIAEGRFGSLWLGGQLSLASFENDSTFTVVTLPSGNTLDGDYTADLLTVTPTLTWRGDIRTGIDGFVRGGAGYYRLALNESYDIYYDDIDDDEAFGGFVGLGLDIRLAEQVSLRLENQVHFVELEAFPKVLPEQGTVDDPIYFFAAGVSYRF